jgi:hypothetical protein
MASRGIFLEPSVSFDRVEKLQFAMPSQASQCFQSLPYGATESISSPDTNIDSPGQKSGTTVNMGLLDNDFTSSTTTDSRPTHRATSRFGAPNVHTYYSPGTVSGTTASPADASRQGRCIKSLAGDLVTTHFATTARLSSRQEVRSRSESDGLEGNWARRRLCGQFVGASSNSRILPSSALSVPSIEFARATTRSLQFTAAEPATHTPSSSLSIDAAAHVATTTADNLESSTPPQLHESSNTDPERNARNRYIRINRCFQSTTTVYEALFYCVLIPCIVLAWISFATAFVMSRDEPCDVPLKLYFWLITFQLALDVVRTPLMKLVFGWDPHSGERAPCLVLAFNAVYIVYAVMVLRLGILCVFVFDNVACRQTAPNLFRASTAFVSLSIAGWVFVCGYLLHLLVVVAMLTYNGYDPSSEEEGGTARVVFPAVYSTTGAPDGSVDLLEQVSRADIPDLHECSICMEDFRSEDVIVKTACGHVFHKSCCREWLRHARTCPFCRAEISSTLHDVSASSA